MDQPRIRIDLPDSVREQIFRISDQIRIPQEEAERLRRTTERIVQGMMSDETRASIAQFLDEIRPQLEQLRDVAVATSGVDTTIELGTAVETQHAGTLSIRPSESQGSVSKDPLAVAGPVVLHLAAFGTLLDLVTQFLGDYLQGERDEASVAFAIYVLLVIVDFLRRDAV